MRFTIGFKGRFWLSVERMTLSGMVSIKYNGCRHGNAYVCAFIIFLIVTILPHLLIGASRAARPVYGFFLTNFPKTGND